jgi:hypothetical protein
LRSEKSLHDEEEKLHRKLLSTGFQRGISPVFVDKGRGFSVHWKRRWKY